MVPDGRSSLGDAVVKVGDSAARAPLIEQLKVETLVPGEGVFAASKHNWPEEQVALVDQARPKRLGSEISSAHHEIVGLTAAM